MDVLLAVKTTGFVALCLGLVGGVMFLFGATFWAAPYDSGITVGQENWSSLFTLTGLVFSGVCGFLLVRGQTRKTLVPAIRLIIPLVPVGIFLALATGWFTTDQGVNPGGITASNYGVPFTWKVQQTSCPPPCVQANGTIYNPLFLALDLLFFILVGYVLLRGYRRRAKAVRGTLDRSKSSC
jgi:hypothetical protein